VVDTFVSCDLSFALIEDTYTRFPRLLLSGRSEIEAICHELRTYLIVSQTRGVLGVFLQCKKGGQIERSSAQPGELAINKSGTYIVRGKQYKGHIGKCVMDCLHCDLY
jgi:hypothetical protein